MNLDGTLRAIVAADRLELSDALDDEALLHRRLAVFYGYFAVLATLGALVSSSRVVFARLYPHVTDFIRGVQAAHAFVLVVVFLVLRFRAPSAPVLRILDAVATLATASAAALTLSRAPAVASVHVAAVGFFILFFVVRSALVPSKPWIATTIAMASATAFSIGLGVVYPSVLAGVVGTFVVSRTIYGLRSAVEKAVQLGQYVVHEKIGEGGMGSVYRASHAMLKRPTAVKVIPPDRSGETSIARFEREVMAASRLTHPNNIAIYDFGRTRGGVFYYAMELVEGEDLARLVEREGPQSIRRTRHILRQIAAALGEAHEAGLVHRDVKPANVMLSTRGGVRDFVKVVDFGLVKDLSAQMKLTEERALAGTPLYMAPESILAPDTVGPPADVYALGCVAYVLLTGRTPFDGTNLVAVCAAHVHEPPAPPSMHRADLPADLDALLLRCLEKNAEARPTARELEAAFAHSDQSNQWNPRVPGTG